MKKFFFILISVVLLNYMHAQHNESIEIGATLLTLNPTSSRYYDNEKPLVEYPNGLFVRYKRNRFSARALVSYSQYKFEDVTLSFDAFRAGRDIRDMRLGFGAQYGYAKRLKWLYVFTDLLYRNVSTYGFTLNENSGAVNTYNTESNGIDGFFGMGASVKIHECFYLIQELGFNARYESVSVSSPNIASFPYNYWSYNLKPMFRMGLTYKLPKNGL